jgi:glycerophosphoryl diester phosphodiesterase
LPILTGINDGQIGQGAVAQTLIEVIRSLDGGSWFSAGYAGEPIPELRTFLEAVLDCGLSLQLELKNNAGLEEPLVTGVVETLKDVWPFGNRGLFLSSFSERCMRLSAASLSDVPRRLATEFTPADPAGRLNEATCQILHVQADLVTEAELQILCETTPEFAVATVNDRA